MNVGRVRLPSKTWRLTAVFALALVVRLVYNLYIAQHRILDVGDSFYYLTAGRSLARLVIESPSIQIFFSHLCTAAKFVPGSFYSFSSLGLSDRLLIDGPIYPSYLATIFLLSGKALETAALNVNQLTFALANSVTDSLLAAALVFVGETAFGVTAGVLAGVCWCFYLPAVVNTQQCYGEPVVALLVTLFVGAMFNQSKQCGQVRDEGMGNGKDESGRRNLDTSGRSRPEPFLSLLVGALGGLVMLAKPAFVILPPVLMALHLIFLAFSGRLRGRPFNIAALFFGVALVLAPWLLYTSTVSGAPRLVANRAPGYNLYIGNYLPTDGWKTWPVVAGVPDSAADARKFIEAEAERQPWDIVSLLLRKIPRLWAGVWNDFHSSCFGFSYTLQNVFQALYLLLATLALAVLCAGKVKQTRPYSFAAAMTMAFAVAFHFIYVLFEPVPRYAFTAMPLVLTLAAAGLVALGRALGAVRKKLRQRTMLQLVFLLLFFSSVCAALYTLRTPVFLWLPYTQEPAPLRLLSGLLMFGLFMLLGTAFVCLLRRINLAGSLTNLICAKSFILAGLIALTGALSDPAYLEWFFKVPKATSGSIETTLVLPDLGRSVPAKVYLLVDAQSERGAPDLNVVINGREAFTYPLPLYELTAAAKDIPTLINIQSRMMDVDPRTFRQWWLYPVDSSLLHFGADNLVELQSGGSSTVKFFGDYCAPMVAADGGETCRLPSLTTFSWSKGFLTADCRDPRVYEEIYFRGHTKGSRCKLADNSPSFANTLRLRLAVPMLGAAMATTPPASAQISLLSQREEKQISGQNPMVIVSPTITMHAPPAPSSILHMQAQMRRNNPDIPATMDLSLDFGPGNPIYSSTWQPSCLRLSKDWESVEFATILPSNSKNWHNMSAHLLLSPYPGDRLYLHRKEALKDSIFVRELFIEILPPPVPGGGPSGALKLI